ncbi:NAD(P) transhydrogenase subunit alpha [Gammaproteobacteria bacterium]|nr:NAD(P) transhydrogenase subunit alpha [Gammaproteobacteria bacterium]
MISIYILLLFILFLSIFLGAELIKKVPAILHTPLMSGMNAISGITIIASISSLGANSNSISITLGFLSLVFASINVVGGYLITHRMLKLFKTTKDTKI